MQLKEFFEYILNYLKFWVIINEWESAILMRRGKMKRSLSAGIFFRIPIIDFVYSQPNRVREIACDQINVLTRLKKGYTISIAIHYHITDVYKFYNSYSEPNEIIAQHVKQAMLGYCSSKEEIEVSELTSHVKEVVSTEIKGKGLELDNILVITITDAKTMRLIIDKSYNNRLGELMDGLMK